MDDAVLYQQSNGLQKRDALQCLEEYAKKIKWKVIDDKVIDIGCGDGSVTNTLKNYMPANFNKLVGCDISDNMVNFANEHHKHERTMFTVLDIEGNLPEEFLGGFDHAFSFYTLHWIKQQEKAFMNIHSLLAEGGECLLVFLAHMPLYNVFRILARRKKWSSWLQDIDSFISPYHDIQEPVKTIKQIMEKVGFININVKCEEKLFTYDSLYTLKKAISAVTPFKMPKNVHNDFIEDYLQVVKNMRLIDKANNNIRESARVKFNYSLIVAHASKR